MKPIWRKWSCAFFCLVFIGCSELEPGNPDDKIDVTLKLIDVGVHEAYLSLDVTNATANESILVTRNGSLVTTVSAAVANTVIEDTVLSGGNSYSYVAILRSGNVNIKQSNEVKVHALTPTSRSFTWQTFILGEANMSEFDDVTIVDDTLAYAAGEFYLKDSTGKLEPDLYNLAAWNGREWLARRVYYNYQGQKFLSPFEAVVATSDHDVWFGGNGLIHLDQYGYNEVPIPSEVWGAYRINRMWRGSGSNLYLVGDGGSAAFYRPILWEQINCGTTLSFRDIWGVVDPMTQDDQAFCVAMPINDYSTDAVIYRITNHSKVESLHWDSRDHLSSIWTNKGYPIFVCGDGFFKSRNGSWEPVALPGRNNYISYVRGNGLNDVFVSDVFGNITHFNGDDWQIFSADASYSSIAAKGNLVIAVGSDFSSRGLITVGIRQ